MVETHQIIRCASCGQLNRRPLQIDKAGIFKCGRCKLILLSAMIDDTKSDLKASDAGKIKRLLPFAAMVATIGLVIFVGMTADQKSAGTASQPVPPISKTAVAKQSPPKSAREVESSTKAATEIDRVASAAREAERRTPFEPRMAPPVSMESSISYVPPTLKDGTVQQLPPAIQERATLPPRTGDLQPRQKKNAIAPFSVITEVGASYLVKLVNVKNNKDQILIFIKGGEPYSTKVALGNYALRVASGDTWYGRQELFGPRTKFFQMRNKNGMLLGENQFLQFRKERDSIVGVILDFRNTRSGNLEQATMSRAEFDAE